MAECETVKERLNFFLKYLNISQGKFQQQCGLANGFVNNIRVSIKPKTLQKIALQYPELSVGWLMTGEGKMLKDSSTNVGEVSGDDNTIGMTVTQTISENSGQNAGRDINNYAQKQLLAELEAQRILAEKQFETFSSCLNHKDDQIRIAQSQIDTLIKQNSEQFNRFTLLLESLMKN